MNLGKAEIIVTDEFKRALLGYGEQQLKKCSDILYRGGLIIANQAKQNLKDNNSVITGNLHDSITVAMDSDIPAQIGSKEAGGVAVLIGTNVIYAKRVEFGFVGTDSLGRNYHQLPKPYLRPAFDEFRQTALDYIGREMQKSFSEQGAGIGWLFE